jgi:hypothetical protein
MFHSPSLQRKRSIITVILAITMLMTLIVVFTLQAHGDDGSDGPAAPSVPTHDIAVIAAGEATKAALDTKEDADQASAQATEVRSEQLGTPSAKTLPTSSGPAPMPVATIEAQSIPTPSNGISIVQSASGGWRGRYRITNMWYGTVGGNKVYLYAGAKLDVPDALGSGSADVGMVLYNTMGVTADAEYLTSPNHGGLTFTSSDGTCLTLTASDSTTLEFDAVGKDWSCN